MEGFTDFIRTSWLHVLPIFLAGVFAAAIIIERIRALFWTYPIRNEDVFFDRIRDLLMSERVTDAVSLCDRYQKKPVAAVVRQGLLRVHQPESLIENGLDLIIERETQRIQRRTAYLAMLANVATLLGLLGTIAGLVVAFNAVGALDAQEKAAYLAKGISQAMHATMMGLVVAVPCMIAFSFLMNRVNRLVSDIESAGIRMMDMVRQRYFEAELRSQKQDDQGVA